MLIDFKYGGYTVKFLNIIKSNRLFRLLKFLKKRWFLYSLGLIGSSFINFAFNCIAAYGLKYLTDAGINHNIHLLYHGLIYMGLGILLITLFFPFLSYAFDYSVKKTTGEIRKTLFKKIELLPMKYIESHHSGDLISRLTNDVSTAENAYSWQINMVLMSLISGIGSGAVLIFMNWKLALIAVVFGLLNVLVNAKYVKPIKKASDEVQKALSDSTQKLSDIIAGTHIIRIFNMSKRIILSYINLNNNIYNWAFRRVKLNSQLSAIGSLFGFMNFIGIVAIGSIMVIHGQSTFGTLIAFIQMQNGLFWMFNSLGNFITQLQSSLAGAQRIIDILDMPSEEEKPHVDIDTSCKTAVEFDNVSFNYENKENILDGLNLTVMKNQNIALVGSSGCGKSTVYKLLLGYYRYKSGEIKIFGKQLEDYSIYDLRSIMAYVPQDNYLFNGTIEDNIRYGKSDATREEVEKAAKAAYAHDFITKLPEGYDTVVGERGARISGGERQRIAIARALLKNAPILLLDEATSSLDSESEQQVQKALEVLMKGRTTLVVAHRLSTIMNADMIYVLSNGKIAESGNHNDLLKLNGIYSYLYNIQFEKTQNNKTA